jgi:inositol phosphorylceramide mannosyltransferase catalytic subunit
MKGSFVNEIFMPRYYNNLDIRKDTFKLFFQNLESLNLKFYVIVETGTSRGGKNSLGDNGSSTYLFDEFVNFYDGIVYSFDNDKIACEKFDKTISNKCKVICKDSVQGINDLKFNNIFEINGLYLNSYDTKFDDDVPSSDHALKEFINSIFYLDNHSIIMIDDTPNDISMLPPWIKNDKKRFGNPNYMNKLKFPCGKGRQILDFIKEENKYNIMIHKYQILFKVKNQDTIPNILHRTWKTKDIDYNLFPKNVVDSWEKYNSNLKFNLHTDEDNLNFIKKYYPWFLKIYNSYPREIFRADAIRYFYLLYYGGIYCDLDMECRKCILEGFTNNLHLVTDKKSWVSNAIMISHPNNIFWKKIIVIGLIGNKDNKNVLYATGPGMISNVFYEHIDSELRDKYHLSPEKYYPIKYYENFSEIYKNLSTDVITIHHFSASWIES